MAINVSTFELLVKPIAPREPIPNEFRGVARRVVQGYFLTITNLFNEDIRFRFNFRASLPPAPGSVQDPNRTFFPQGSSPNNVDFLYDIAGENLPLENQFSSGSRLLGNTSNFRGEFTLPRFQTATVQLLPRLTRSVLRDSDPELEIRGFLELSVPTTPTRIVDGTFVRGEPQTQEVVPVLLQPEIRGTFLPNNLSTGNVDFDQINYTLLTSSGQASNEIVPDGVTSLSFSSELQAAVMENFELNPSVFENFVIDPTTQLSDLIVNLGNIDPSAENLTQISNLLTEMGIPITMQPTTK